MMCASGYQVDVTELIKPEAVHSCGGFGKFKILERGVDLCYAFIQLVKNPSIPIGICFHVCLIHERRYTQSTYRLRFRWYKYICVCYVEEESSEFGCIPYLVAKVAIAHDAIDIHVDVPSLGCVCN